jgi:hypothetical protein
MMLQGACHLEIRASDEDIKGYLAAREEGRCQRAVWRIARGIYSRMDMSIGGGADRYIEDAGRGARASATTAS